MIGTVGGGDNSTEVTTGFSRAIALPSNADIASEGVPFHPFVPLFRYLLPGDDLTFVIPRTGSP
jgi:hypothetical protein